MLTHIAVNTWTLDEAQTKKNLRGNITVKLGRKSGPDIPENWHFMVGEGPGNGFYYEIYKRAVCRPSDAPPLNQEHGADMLEGLYGLYHGLKRLQLDKRHTIAS